MAADQIEIQIPEEKILEESSFVATVYFRNRATKAAVVPTTVRYRVESLDRRIEIQDWTTVTPASSVDITMTSTFNEIQSDQTRLETKQLIVQADAGLSTQFNGRKTWKVRNMIGIT